MKKTLKYIGIFLVIFIISFLCIHVFGFANCYGDPINSYGFAKAISMGQVPYRDFNTISTPLYAMYQALFLFVYDDFVMISISQALLVTIEVILLYKMFGKKTLFLLPVVAFFQYRNMVATYNSLSLLFIIVLMYMEKKHQDKDYLIGILIALSIMAKQTVGCFMIIPSLIFYRKDLKKLFRRFVGFLIPCFIFLIYLLVTKSFVEFWDLCLFGMFDFLNRNGVGGGHFNIGWILLTLITFIIGIIIMIKNKKDINNYYLIWGVLFTFPLFDITHFSFWLTCFVLMVIPYINKYVKQINFVSTAVSVTFMVLCFCCWTLRLDLCVPGDIKHFKFNLYRTSIYENIKKMDKFVNSYEDPVVIGYYSMTHTLINDKMLSYFDVPYDGNYGYDGISKMKKKIDEMHDRIFIVSVRDYEDKDEFSQFSKEIAEYVINNCEKIDSKYIYDVYYKE